MDKITFQNGQVLDVNDDVIFDIKNMHSETITSWTYNVELQCYEKTITHNLNTLDISLQSYDNINLDYILLDYYPVTNNTCTILSNYNNSTSITITRKI
jgi:hypothetical protein